MSRASAGQHVQDFGDQAAGGGAVPAVAVEQSGCRVVREREQQAFVFGLVQGLLQGPPGGGRITEGVAGDLRGAGCSFPSRSWTEVHVIIRRDALDASMSRYLVDRLSAAPGSSSGRPL